MKILLGLTLVLLVACGSKTVRYSAATTPLTRPAIIFIPGFYGSALADPETGERFFLTAWGATFGKTPLALTDPDLGIPDSRPLREDGVLAHVRIIPGIYSANVYGSAMDFLESKFGKDAEIVPFSYDWRRDIGESAGRLDALVGELKARGTPRVLIVAHSMGGLLAAHYLGQPSYKGRGLVAATVIAGTPFAGAITAFRNLQIGTALGASSVPLSYESMGTFPSMYQLLPPSESGAYLTPSGAALTEDVLSPEVWRTAHFGLLRERSDLSPALREKRETFVTRSLARAREFFRGLSGAAEKDAPAMLYFVGTGSPTFSRAMWSGKTLHEKGIWLYDEETVKTKSPGTSLYEDGDGTVSTKSATPPAGLVRRLPGEIVQVAAHHEAMFECEPLLAAVEKFLRTHLK